LKMVKSLKLIDMKAIDGEAMPMIFKKIKWNQRKPAANNTYSK
jgi:hypothetical protein